jgi:hypothetical protein
MVACCWRCNVNSEVDLIPRNKVPILVRQTSSVKHLRGGICTPTLESSERRLTFQDVQLKGGMRADHVARWARPGPGHGFRRAFRGALREGRASSADDHGLGNRKGFQGHRRSPHTGVPGLNGFADARVGTPAPRRAVRPTLDVRRAAVAGRIGSIRGRR